MAATTILFCLAVVKIVARRFGCRYVGCRVCRCEFSKVRSPPLSCILGNVRKLGERRPVFPLPCASESSAFFELLSIAVAEIYAGNVVLCLSRRVGKSLRTVYTQPQRTSVELVCIFLLFLLPLRRQLLFRHICVSRRKSVLWVRVAKRHQRRRVHICAIRVRCHCFNVGCPCFASE